MVGGKIKAKKNYKNSENLIFIASFLTAIIQSCISKSPLLLSKSLFLNYYTHYTKKPQTKLICLGLFYSKNIYLKSAFTVIFDSIAILPAEPDTSIP
jgi:hypothetical protein